RRPSRRTRSSVDHARPERRARAAVPALGAVERRRGRACDDRRRRAVLWPRRPGRWGGAAWFVGGPFARGGLATPAGLGSLPALRPDSRGICRRDRDPLRALVSSGDHRWAARSARAALRAWLAPSATRCLRGVPARDSAHAPALLHLLFPPGDWHRRA